LTHINCNFSHNLNYIDTNQSRFIGSDCSYNCLLDANRIGTAADFSYNYNSGLAKVVQESVAHIVVVVLEVMAEVQEVQWGPRSSSALILGHLYSSIWLHL